MSDDAHQKPKKKHKRHLTGKGPGYRNDIPWESIRALYIEGEVKDHVGGVTERVWPTMDDLAVRFNVTQSAIDRHSMRGGWKLQREEHKRKLAQESQAKTEAFVQSAADVWSKTALRALNLVDRSFREIEYAQTFFESGAATTRKASPKKGSRPSGGDDDAQHGDGTQPIPPAMRDPMPARDQAYIAQTIARNVETVKAVIFGTVPTSTSPATAPQHGASVPDAVSKNPRVADAMKRFIDAAASGNKAPPPSGS